MVDVHCHLNFNVFKDDYGEVIQRALEAGVTKIINVGTKIDSSQKAVELAEKYDSPAGKLYAIVGIHPHHADKIMDSGQARMTKSDKWIKQLEQLARHPKVVGIGECGMDYYRYQSNDIVDPKLQREVFIKQIELAHQLKKPLQIHNRHAGKDIIDILLNHKSYLLNRPTGGPGMFHCMSGDLAFLKKALGLGFYVGFDGNITYKGLAPGENTDLKDLVRATPLDRIVLETDSPYLPPVPFRGQRNEPKNVIIVGKIIAELKKLTFEEVSQQTTKNAVSLFKL